MADSSYRGISRKVRGASRAVATAGDGAGARPQSTAWRTLSSACWFCFSRIRKGTHEAWNRGRRALIRERPTKATPARVVVGAVSALARRACLVYLGRRCVKRWDSEPLRSLAMAAVPVDGRVQRGLAEVGSRRATHCRCLRRSSAGPATCALVPAGARPGATDCCYHSIGRYVRVPVGTCMAASPGALEAGALEPWSPGGHAAGGPGGARHVTSWDPWTR
jgi:hypothetical protein